MAARFWVGGTGTWDASDTTHWAATSGGAGGQPVPVAGDDVTINASSGAGTITVATNFNIATLTCGAMGMTLDFSANNNSPTITNNISTSGTGTRTINWGSGTFTLSGGNATVFGNGTNMNETMTGSATFNFTYAGSIGTRQVQFGGTGAGTFISTTCSVNVTAGTDIFSFSGTNTGVPSLNFTGFSGTWASSSTTISFATNLVMSPTMTNSVTAGLQWTISSSTGSITSNGKTFTSAITFNSASSTYSLSDNLSTTGALTLTAGTFNANGFGVTCSSFSSSNSNTRTLTMGSGTWTITGTGNVWNFVTVTGLTYDVGTSTVVISDTSASSKTIASPSSPVAFYNLTITPGGAGAIIWSGTVSRSMNILTITGPKTIQWAASGTYVIASWNVQGSSGNNVVFNSTLPGTRYTFSDASGLVDVRYVTIQDSLATGGAYFQATNSTDSGNNSGWNFASASAGGGLQVGKKFARFGGARAINEVMDSKLHGYRKLGG